jgi:hypothetical protein
LQGSDNNKGRDRVKVTHNTLGFDNFDNDMEIFKRTNLTGGYVKNSHVKTLKGQQNLV